MRVLFLSVASALGACAAPPPPLLPTSSAASRATDLAGRHGLPVLTDAPSSVESPQDPLQTGQRRDRGEPRGSWGERVQVDAFWIPGYFATIESEVNGVEVRSDLDPGMGFGTRVAVGNANQSAGLLYLGGWFDGDTTTGDASLQSLYLDFETRAQLAEGGGKFQFTAGAGLGVSQASFDRTFDDEVGGSALLRMTLDFAPTERAAFTAGLGGFILGHPGETLGWGSFLILGGRLSF